MPKKNLIGQAVRRMRTSRDWSQDVLAARCQRMGWALSRGTLAKIEAGIRRVNDGEIALLASVLEVVVSDFFPNIVAGKFDAEALEVARHSEE